MNKKAKILLAVAAFAILIIVSTIVYNSLSKDFKPKEQDNTKPIDAPNFTVYDIKGKQVKLSQYFGKPIVLNFWASWCPPCKGEMPDFNKVYGEVKGDVVFLMIDMIDGQRETMQKGQKYIEDNGFSFDVLFDIDQSAAYTYSIRSIPTTIFISKEGKIVGRKEGLMDEQTLRKGIEAIK